MDILKSKKAQAGIVTIIATLLSTYVFKDTPELAETIAVLIVTIGATFIGGQAAADAFGGDTYHNKKKGGELIIGQTIEKVSPGVTLSPEEEAQILKIRAKVLEEQWAKHGHTGNTGD